MPDGTPVRPNGMSSAAAALQMLERRHQVLANNLANISTRGYKAETAFARLMDDALAATDTAVDLRQGNLSETRNPLDLALDGQGFFVISTAAGERYVRSGSFQLDADRTIVDEHGNPLLGNNGKIVVPPGTINIDDSGMVSVDGRRLQRLRVETVTDVRGLQHEGGTRFVPNESRATIAVEDRKVRQGFVEESNVNPMSAMTQMLEVLHRYSAAQRTLSTLDTVRGIAVNDLAKPV